MTETRQSTRPRSWQEMFAQVTAQLERQSGDDLATWNARIQADAPHAGEPGLRRWLAARNVTGYPAMLLVYETFGYPDYLKRDAEELIDGQYRDRPGLRPIYERLLELAI